MRSKEYRQKAWNMLANNNNYWQLFAAFAIVAIVGSISIPILIGIVIIGPITVGLMIINLNTYRLEEFKVENLIKPFNESFVTSFVTPLLKMIFIFLWTLLLIIPGIIKSYSYAMTDFIIADNPKITPTEAINRSRELMNGHKWRLFKLNFSFIGWILLGILAFGVGLFFVYPYILAANTAFYLDLIGEGDGNNKIDYEINKNDYEVDFD